MNPAIVIAALRFLVGGKELKIALGILATLILLPALAVTVIVSTPEAILKDIFGLFDPPGISGTLPKPTGVMIDGNLFFAGDEYAPGNCTYWVYMRRMQVGKPIPNTWGDAATWAPRAAAGGYSVDHTPSPDAIMQTPNAARGLGHVAFVESVDQNGTWHISEMNVYGLYIVDDRAMPPSSATAYNFIHAKQ